MAAEFQYLVQVLDEDHHQELARQLEDKMEGGDKERPIDNEEMLPQNDVEELLRRSHVPTLDWTHDASSEAALSYPSCDESDWLPSSPDSSTTCDESTTSSEFDSVFTGIFVKQEARCKFIESTVPAPPPDLIVNPLQSSLPEVAPADSLVGIKLEPGVASSSSSAGASANPDLVLHRVPNLGPASSTSTSYGDEAETKLPEASFNNEFNTFRSSEDDDAQLLEFVSGCGFTARSPDTSGSNNDEGIDAPPLPPVDFEQQALASSSSSSSSAPAPASTSAPAPAPQHAVDHGKRPRESGHRSSGYGASSAWELALSRYSVSASTLKEIGAMQELMGLISTQLTANPRGERDFEGLKRRILDMKELPAAVHECLNSSFKQKVKNLVQERRKRAQLDSWKALREAPDLRAELRARLPDSAKYDQPFLETIASYLEVLFEADKKAPGDLLDWPEGIREAVINKAVFLHKNFYGNRLFDLYQDLGFLFALGELQIAVLSRCDCADCFSSWNLGRVERTNRQALKLHWTREVAALLRRLLNLHVELGAEMFHHVATSEPKLRDWDPKHVNVLLKSLHTSTKCAICRQGKRLRHRGADDKQEAYHRHSFDTCEYADFTDSDTDSEFVDEDDDDFGIGADDNQSHDSHHLAYEDELGAACSAFDALRLSALHDNLFVDLYLEASSAWELAEMYDLD